MDNRVLVGDLLYRGYLNIAESIRDSVDANEALEDLIGMKYADATDKLLRAIDSKIAESGEDHNWLTRNIANALDIIFVTAFMIIIFSIVYNGIEDASPVLMLLIGGLVGNVNNIISFHRGSSSGSKDKDEYIKELTQQR